MNAEVLDTAQAETDFLMNYRYPAGGYDEMCLPSGALRPHWQYLTESLNSLGREELEKRWQEARRLLRDNGVTYNVHGDPQGRDRPWQLDPVPLLIASEEWRQIERGLVQRAELMNLLLSDLYGSQESLRRGLLPVELIAAYPGFLHPCTKIAYPHRQRLPLYAVDLVRTLDGHIWAVSDRTQSPAGAGYALENRLVLSRVLPSLFRDSQVHRLALFFRTLRATLASLSPLEDPRIVVMTPGSNTGAYFEHAYLARYLGYTLVQGADLTVREGRICLKTLDGLQPVDVILRRVGDNDCDPLELRPDTAYGVAGLLQSARMQRVALANPLGSAVLENCGLAAFLPTLAQYFLGETLHIPSPATWWCGQPQGCSHVLANLEKLMIKRVVPLAGSTTTTLYGRLLSRKQRDLLRDQIRTHPHLYVGTEELQRSTTPVLANGQLEPRQMVLRSFLVSSEDGYMVMPGGLTRVSASLDNPNLSLHNGGISKDTWVMASEPEKQLTLITTMQTPLVFSEGQGELPSRVAENLFWLGRYVERAEGTIRLLRDVLLYLLDPYAFPNPQNPDCLYSLLRAVTGMTETWPGFTGDNAKELLESPEDELISVILDKSRMGSLSSTLQSVLNSAYSVRDRLSMDMWRVINSIDDELIDLQGHDSIKLEYLVETLDKLIRSLAAFNGMSMENMTHEQGWRFMMVGRSLERAYYTSSLLRSTLSTSNPDDAALLEHLLTITDSLLTYRRRYRSQLQVSAALELILQSERNPRSIGSQLDRLQRYINIFRHGEGVFRSHEGRLVLEMLSSVRLANMDTLAATTEDGFRSDLDQLLVRLSHLLPNLSDAITNAWFSHAEQPRQLLEINTEASDAESV